MKFKVESSNPIIHTDLHNHYCAVFCNSSL